MRVFALIGGSKNVFEQKGVALQCFFNSKMKIELLFLSDREHDDSSNSVYACEFSHNEIRKKYIGLC